MYLSYGKLVANNITLYSVISSESSFIWCDSTSVSVSNLYINSSSGDVIYMKDGEIYLFSFIIKNIDNGIFIFASNNKITLV